MFKSDYKISVYKAVKSNGKSYSVNSGTRQNWPYSLLEALSPRTESYVGGAGGGARRRGPRAPAEGPDAGPFLRHFSEDSTPTDIVAAFKHAEQRELQAIKELR